MGSERLDRMVAVFAVWRAYLWRAIVVAVAFNLAYHYSLSVQSFSSLNFVYWPPVGVLAGGLLITPVAGWLPVLTIASGSNLIFELIAGRHPVIAVGVLIAQTTTSVIAAYLIRRWQVGALQTIVSVLKLGVASLAASVIGGAVAAAVVLAAGVSRPYLLVFSLIVGGFALGIVTMAPLASLVDGAIPLPRERGLEQTLAFVASAAIATAVFVMENRDIARVLDYLIVIPLLWLAIRIRVGGVLIMVAVVAHIGMFGTMAGFGPFSPLDFGDLTSSILLQGFIAVTSLSVILLATRTEEVETLEDSAADRDSLLAVVSHELRTPLTAILGFTDTVLRRNAESDEGERVEMLEVVRRNAERLNGLIDNLLLLSRSRAEALAAKPTLVEAGTFVEQVVAERLHQDVDIQRPVEPIMVVVDQGHFEQILNNLLENAVKYGRAPYVARVTKPMSLDDGSSVVYIVVEDHGDGVPEWFGRYLFDPFAQATTGDRRTSQGLGLGLPICRELARANYGDLEHDLSYTSGARFVLRLPTALDNEQSERDADGPATWLTSARGRWRHGRSRARHNV